MPAPLNPNLWATVLHDEDGNAISASNPLPVGPGGGGGDPLPTKGVPGATITTDADVAIGAGLTVPIAVTIPSGTRRFTVQNTGPAGTWVRVRELGGAVGSGQLLPRLGSYTYGGGDGAIAKLEVQDVSNAVGGAPVATTISVQYERD
jgi:hypothetical protein